MQFCKRHNYNSRIEYLRKCRHDWLNRLASISGSISGCTSAGSFVLGILKYIPDMVRDWRDMLNGEQRTWETLKNMHV